MLGWLQDHCITHYKGRYQGRKCLVERIIEWSHAEHNTHWGSSNLTNDSLFNSETGRGSIHFFKRGEGIVNVFNRTFEFVYRILKRFSNLPHQKSNYLILCL